MSESLTVDGGHVSLFCALQRRLADQFTRFADDPKQPYTAVVVPSQSVDPAELEKLPGVEHYEERSLFNLMLLRHPRLRLVYVTSKRLNPLIVDYYLHQMRAVPRAHALRRLELLDCDDASPRPLTRKILDRPRLMERIRSAIDDPAMAHLVVFNATDLERKLSVELGIPLNACDPDLSSFGTKSGSRKAFMQAGVPVLPGHEDLRDAAEVAAGIADLCIRQPELRRVVVKLNDSFSGEGNAVLDLDPLPSRTASVIANALPRMRFEADGLTWAPYEEQLNLMGGICEAWYEAPGKTSPSVQMRINPLRKVQTISTHDQVLGGPSGQIFLGATFPAEARYRVQLQDYGRQTGEVLAEQGVIGRFGVDFVAGADGEIYALEINLRQGGTTHPFNTLKFLTGGHYEEETGRFFTAQGRERAYYCTDTLVSEAYRGLLPFDLIDAMVVGGIHFRSDDTGVVFHLLGCLSEYGKLGCTAIGKDLDEAKALFAATRALLDELAAEHCE